MTRSGCTGLSLLSLPLTGNAGFPWVNLTTYMRSSLQEHAVASSLLWHAQCARHENEIRGRRRRRGSSGNNQGDPAGQGLKLGSMDNYIWTGRQLKPSIYFADAIDLCK